MINLIMNTNENLYIASSNNQETHNLHSEKHDVYELYKKAMFALLDYSEFEFENFEFNSPAFNARYNNELGGYEIVFSDGNVAYTQLNKSKLTRTYEHDNIDLSENQSKLVDNFVYQINEINEYFAELA